MPVPDHGTVDVRVHVRERQRRVEEDLTGLVSVARHGGSSCRRAPRSTRGARAPGRGRPWRRRACRPSARRPAGRICRLFMRSGIESGKWRRRRGGKGLRDEEGRREDGEPRVTEKGDRDGGGDGRVARRGNATSFSRSAKRSRRSAPLAKAAIFPPPSARTTKMTAAAADAAKFAKNRTRSVQTTKPIRRAMERDAARRKAPVPQRELRAPWLGSSSRRPPAGRASGGSARRQRAGGRPEPERPAPARPRRQQVAGPAAPPPRPRGRHTPVSATDCRPSRRGRVVVRVRDPADGTDREEEQARARLVGHRHDREDGERDGRQEDERAEEARGEDPRAGPHALEVGSREVEPDDRHDQEGDGRDPGVHRELHASGRS